MLLTAVLFSALASLVSADFSIATPPSLVQCQPVSISWTDGTAPFILSAIPEGQISAEPLKYIKEGIQSSPYTWVVDLPAGTSLNIKILDGTGAYQFTSGLTVQKGSSDDCLKAATSSAAAGTSEAPAQTSEAPAQTSEAPAQTSEAPAASSQAPAASSQAPAQTSVAPGGAVSASSAAHSAASSVKPAASSAAPSPATTSSGANAMAVAVPAVAAAVAGALLF